LTTTALLRFILTFIQYIVSADGQVHIVVAVCYKVKKHYITFD